MPPHPPHPPHPLRSPHSPSTETIEGPIILIGGGGHAAVVADAARTGGFEVLGFADDDPSVTLPGISHLGAIDGVLADPGHADVPVILAMGPSPLRDRLVLRLAEKALAIVIHPSAIVSADASIARGVFVGPGAIINARARILAHAIVNSAAIVEHDCVVGVGAHVAPASTMGGGSKLGDHSLLGIGAVALPGISIGARATVGASALVNRDVRANETVAGIPARVLTQSA